MTKKLTPIDRMHREMFGHKTKYDLRFEQEVRDAAIILARAQGGPVPDTIDAIEQTATPRRPIVRERLPIKRERLDPATPKAPVTLSMTERYAMNPPSNGDRGEECLVNVSRSPVSHLQDIARVATTSHQVNQSRVTNRAIQQVIRKFEQ